MAKKKKPTIPKHTIQIAIVVAIVLVASLFASFTSAPEKIYVRSEDGLVEFEGVARPAGTVSINREDEINGADGIMSPVFSLSTSEEVVVDRGEVLFHITKQELDITELDVYTFDVVTLNWEPLPTIFDLSQRTISASIEFSGTVLVGVGQRL